MKTQILLSCSPLQVSVLEKLGRVCVSTSFATAGALSLYDAVRPSFSLYFKRAWKGVKNTYLGGNKVSGQLMLMRCSLFG